MTPADEATFIALWQQGLSQDAMTQRLGIPRGTVASRAHRFALENVGLIAAESVSVNHLTFRYTKTGERTGRVMTGFDLPISGRRGFRWMYASKLEPHERTPPKLTGQFVPPSNSPKNETQIAILFFEISYLRPTDGKQYQKRCVFYKEGDGF